MELESPQLPHSSTLVWQTIGQANGWNVLVRSNASFGRCDIFMRQSYSRPKASEHF